MSHNINLAKFKLTFSTERGYNMNLDQINDVPDIVMEFLEYHSTVRGHSDRTVAGYYLDLKIHPH